MRSLTDSIQYNQGYGGQQGGGQGYGAYNPYGQSGNPYSQGGYGDSQGYNNQGGYDSGRPQAQPQAQPQGGNYYADEEQRTGGYGKDLSTIIYPLTPG